MFAWVDVTGWLLIDSLRCGDETAAMPNTIEASAKSPAADLPDLSGYIFYIKSQPFQRSIKLINPAHTHFKLVKPHSNGAGNKRVNTSSAVWRLSNSMHGFEL